MDYSFFDSLIDGVFVFNQDKEVTYCNEAAASLVGMSVRRVLKSKKVYELISFNDSELFCMPNGQKGETETVPNTELEFKNLKSNEIGKIQLTLQPFLEPCGSQKWILILHDVTLEETLHTKYHAQLDAKEEVIGKLKSANEKIENYSKNLEKMVAERTEALNEANMTLKAIMNSLGQGFLTFNNEGLCGDIFTKACESILEVNPKGKMIWEVLRLKENELPHIKMWLQACFQENLPFDSLKDLGPSEYEHSQNWHISLEFYPIRDVDNKILQVVMVATDKTKQVEAEKAMEIEKQNSLMLIKLVKNKDQFIEFIASSKEKINWLQSIDKSIFNLEESFRILHTLEGEASMFSAKKIVDSAKNCQQILEPLKTQITEEREPIIEEFFSSLPSLSRSYEEFLSDNQELFYTFGVYSEEKSISIALDTIEHFYKYLQTEPKIIEVITEFDYQFRRVGINTLISHYDEVVQLVAEKTGKKVQPLNILKNNIRVYHNSLKPILNSLVHVFRNAVDHGIEPPDQRVSVDKPEEGMIQVECVENENTLQIRIIDDGKGIDPNIIRSKMPEKSKNLDDHQVLQLIFEPGFSSKEQISDFSGRGIGMDAVKHSIHEYGGKITVNSTLGEGTQLVIDLPLDQLDTVYRTAA